MLIKDLLIEAQNSIQKKFLEILCNESIPTKIYLRNGIALQGFIKAFDQEVIILKNQESQLVYKSSIATVMSTFGVKEIAQKKSIPQHTVIYKRKSSKFPSASFQD